MSSKAVKKSLALIGKVSLSHVRDANKGTGDMWQAALDVAAQSVQSDFPDVTGMKITGARAHQSHTTESHSNVISTKFYAGEQRVISGHVHINGTIDYSQKARTGGGSGSSGNRWEPTRDQVDQVNWVVYDPERKKNRQVLSEGDWWYIEIGGSKIWF